MSSSRGLAWTAYASQTHRRIIPSVKGLFAGNSLKAQALRGDAWLGTRSIAEQGSRFIRNMNSKRK
jgi:hypothetical protein